jgi:mannan endo-1,4-beta-mannosidase
MLTCLLLAALISPASRPAQAAPSGSKVMQYINSISGTKTIAGQHNREPNAEPAKWTNAIHATTGRYPGLWSGDFLFYQEEIAARWTMIAEAKRQWNSGAVVNIMWHACPPTQGEACGWEGGVMSHLADWQWNELVTPGTGLNNAWKARIDTIVPYLQDLKNNGVEVLWRPLHEMNQGAFWWGGRPGPNGTRKLYQLTHDYLTAKGLTNLIWVWDVQDLSWDFADYNPGDAYWDIAALDVYGGDGFTTRKYEAMLAVAGNKPIAIGETERLPSPEVLAAQPRWVFFMAWAELVYNANSESEIRRVYGDGRVITRDELPGWNAPPSANLARSRPASASSSEGPSRSPNLAVDGDPATRWSSAWSEPHWLQVDLGAAYVLNRVVLRWETAYGRAYQVQVSHNGASWTTIANITAGDGGIDDLAVGGSGRYLRVLGLSRATEWGFSLWEFEAYGTAAPPAGANLARSRPASASSSESASRSPNLAVDGDPATRWSSAWSEPHWLQVDLGAAYVLNRVVLRWETAYGRAYQVQVSNDGASWTTIANITAGDGGIDDLAVGGSGRYLRVLGLSRATEWGFSLWEFEAYGSAVGGP